MSTKKTKVSRRIIAFALTLIMAANFIAVDIAKAAEVEPAEQVDNGRTNYNFEEIVDNDNIHYTYEENGKTYSVYESMNDAFTESSTRVYVLDEGVEVLVEEYVTRIETINGAIYMCKYEDGVVVEQRLIDAIVESSNSNAMFARATYNGKIYYEGSTRRYFTGWYYAYEDIGSSIVANLSLTGVAAIVGVIVGYEAKDVDVGTEVYAVAKQVVDALIPIIYWKKDVYHVSQIRYPERTYYGSFVAQRIYSKIYADQAKTKLIKSMSYETRDSVEWPSTITIGNS